MSTAIARLKQLNPHVEIEGYNSRIEYPAAWPWVEAADLVIDARYDFPERYALNRLCVDTNTPMVEAAMYGFEISLTTVIPGLTPCLECLYPVVPPQWGAARVPGSGRHLRDCRLSGSAGGRKMDYRGRDNLRGRNASLQLTRLRLL